MIGASRRKAMREELERLRVENAELREKLETLEASILWAKAIGAPPDRN